MSPSAGGSRRSDRAGPCHCRRTLIVVRGPGTLARRLADARPRVVHGIQDPGDGPHHAGPWRPAGALADVAKGRLEGADDLEVLADEDVVRPVDADVVGLVLAVAQLHNTVDDAPRVGGQRSFRRLIR